MLGFFELSEPTEVPPPSLRDRCSNTLSHCVLCGITDYRCYTPTSFRKDDLSQAKCWPWRGVVCPDRHAQQKKMGTLSRNLSCHWGSWARNLAKFWFSTAPVMLVALLYPNLLPSSKNKLPLMILNPTEPTAEQWVFLQKMGFSCQERHFSAGSMPFPAEKCGVCVCVLLRGSLQETAGDCRIRDQEPRALASFDKIPGHPSHPGIVPTADDDDNRTEEC